MRYAARTIGAILTMTALATGCGPDEQAVPDGVSTAGSELSPEQLQVLAMRYPVLGEEPVPAPTPSDDATPSDVPDRVEDALSDGALETVTGEATFYADQFEGRRTASGIPFRQNQMVAAHRGYPFGTLLRVTNLRNDRAVNVRVVDRGPHGAVAKARNTIIDLSRRAAERLGYIGAGRTPVRIEVLEWGRGVPTG